MLGPANITKNDQIPIEQCISTCKLRPGSGCLGVKVLADGPTRVLQITDCLQQVRPVRKRTFQTVSERKVHFKSVKFRKSSSEALKANKSYWSILLLLTHN